MTIPLYLYVTKHTVCITENSFWTLH